MLGGRWSISFSYSTVPWRRLVIEYMNHNFVYCLLKRGEEGAEEIM